MLTNTIQTLSIMLCSGPETNKVQKTDAGFTSLLVRVGLAAFLIFALGNNHVQAQQAREITGTVTDAGDETPLPGVNILVPGTTTGTTTGLDGTYSLNVPADADSLIFSFIGYLTQRVPINGRNVINVVLEPNIEALSEVVVVGYGTQERQQITGSISSVDEEDFVKGSVSNVSQLVQGKIPGLVISSAGGGNPNSNPTLRLRGISSFGSTQEPLVVIDGVIGGNLDNVDPQDIASVDVLKDASASAIYGTRGSAGVIVITTKSGGVGGPAGEQVSLSYDGYASYETVANSNDILSASQYRNLAEITGIDAPELGTSTDWFDQITRNAMSNVHSLALAGGSENSSYRISGNFRDNEGIQKHTGFQQINSRLNFTQTALDQRLRFDIVVGITSRKEDLGFPDAFRYAQTFNPTAPVRVDTMPTTGGYFEQPLFDYFNPVAIIETAEREREEQFFTGSIQGAYEFREMIPNFRVSALYSIENNSTRDREFYAKTNKLVGFATSTAFGAGSATRNESNVQEELFEVTANYTTDLDELGLEALAGYSYSSITDEGTNTTGGDYVTDAVGFNNLEYTQDFIQGEGFVGAFQSFHKIIGFFGRVNLNWDNTYFANASIRREGSSWFGVDNKWGTFWSAGVGVELTNVVEMPSFLNSLKLRGSYGVTGQDAPFSGISLQRFGPQGFYLFNGDYIQTFTPQSNPNPDLKWEEQKSFNVGADFLALDARLSGSVEYYQKDTEDLLFEIQVPVPPNLFPTTWDNVGSLSSSGFEVGLGYDVFQDTDLSWNTGVTFSWFSEVILEEFISDDVQFVSNAGSPGLNSTPLIKVEEGAPIGEIFGKVFAEIGPDGEWLFFDSEGNMVTADQITLDDQRVLGNGLPNYQLGWTNSFSYKSWDLSFFLRGMFGHQLVNTYRLFYETPNQISSYNVLDSAFDVVELRESPQFSDFQVENADFVKLQYATLGYRFPMADNDFVRSLRVYLSVNNAFTITGYKGINPEPRYVDTFETTGTGDDSALAPGIERRDQWFTSRTFSLGISLAL